ESTLAAPAKSAQVCAVAGGIARIATRTALPLACIRSLPAPRLMLSEPAERPTLAGARHAPRACYSMKMSSLYVPLPPAPETREEPALWFAFKRSEILVLNGSGQPELPCCMDLSEHGLAAERSQYLGLYGGKHCYAVVVSEAHALPDGWSTLGLRDLFGLV